MDVTADIVRVGVVAGISILIAIFGFPFFVFDRTSDPMKFTPFRSNAAITVSVSGVCPGVSSNSFALSENFVLFLIRI